MKKKYLMWFCLGWIVKSGLEFMYQKYWLSYSYETPEALRKKSY